jgi:hypothetical protein
MLAPQEMGIDPEQAEALLFLALYQKSKGNAIATEFFCAR